MHGGSCAGQREGGLLQFSPRAEFGMLSESDFFPWMARTLGRNSLSHQWRRNHWHSLAGEVGKTESLVRELAGMIQEATVVQEQECKMAGCPSSEWWKLGASVRKLRYRASGYYRYKVSWIKVSVSMTG